MKSLVFVSVAVAFSLGLSVQASALGMRTDTLNVSGNCGMCKKRIESPFKDRTGVESAKWDKKTKKFVVTYDDAVIKREEIQDLVVKQGYDTDGTIAADDVYNALPNCCKYRSGGEH